MIFSKRFSSNSLLFVQSSPPPFAAQFLGIKKHPEQKEGVRSVGRSVVDGENNLSRKNKRGREIRNTHTNFGDQYCKSNFAVSQMPIG